MKVIIKKILFCTIFSFLLNTPVDQSWYKSILKSTKDFVLDHQNQFIFGALITGLVGIAAWTGWKFWKSEERSENKIKDDDPEVMTVYSEGSNISDFEDFSEKVKLAQDKFQTRKRIPNSNGQTEKKFQEDAEFKKIFNDAHIWNEVRKEVSEQLLEEIKNKNEKNKQTVKPIQEQKIEESMSLSHSSQEIPINKSIEVKNARIYDIEKTILDAFKAFLENNIFYYYKKGFFDGGIGESNINKFLKTLNISTLMEDNKNEKNFIENTLKNVFLTYQSWYPEMIKRYIQKRFEQEKQPIETKEKRSTRFSFLNKQDQISVNNSEHMILELPQVESVDTILKKLFEEEKKLIDLQNYSDQFSILNTVSSLFRELYDKQKHIYSNIKTSQILRNLILKKRFVRFLKENHFINFNDISKIQDNKQAAQRYITLLNNEQKLKQEKELLLI
jgi:hypothetical protein